MLVFESASSVETPVNWGGDLWTLHANASDAEAQFEDRVSLIVDKVLNHMDYEGEYGLIMCFSDQNQNFRKEILSTYKGNRAGKLKPVCYGAVREPSGRDASTNGEERSTRRPEGLSIRSSRLLIASVLRCRPVNSLSPFRAIKISRQSLVSFLIFYMMSGLRFQKNRLIKIS